MFTRKYGRFCKLRVSVHRLFPERSVFYFYFVRIDVMDVMNVRVNEHAGCSCDSTLQGKIRCKEIREFSGETGDLLFFIFLFYF